MKHPCVDVMVTPVARSMSGAVLAVQLTEGEGSGQAVLANEGRERIAMAEKDRSHGIQKKLVPGREEGREQRKERRKKRVERRERSDEKRPVSRRKREEPNEKTEERSKKDP